MSNQQVLVHVFDDTPHHYIPMQSFFAKLKKTEFKQLFFVREPADISGITALPFDGTTYKNGSDLIAKLELLDKNVQVVFHGLFDLNNIAAKLIFRKFTSRCSCIIWGAEIYRHTQPNRNIKQKLAQVLHTLVLKRFNKVFALNIGDAELVGKQLLRKNVDVLPYPLISNRFSLQTAFTNNALKPIRLLVGNSAAESNEHFYALDKLLHLSDDNVEIHMPLNYAGDSKYVAKVIAHGKKLFGCKFIPITEMLDKKSYDNLLLSTDVAIFAHQRQQGLYVAYAMLQMGKLLYIRKDTSSFHNLTAIGFDINCTEKLSEVTFEHLVKNIQIPGVKNASVFEDTFTESALLPKWRGHFLSLFV